MSSTGQMASNSNTTFNPEAPEFVPATGRFFKRKVSASAQTGKTSQRNWKTASVPEPAIIRSTDLFDTEHFEPAPQSLTTSAVDEYVSAMESASNLITPGAPRDHQANILTRRSLQFMRQSIISNIADPRLKPAVMLICHGDSQDTNRLQYLPLCSALTTGHEKYENDYVILPQHRERIEKRILSHSQKAISWPAGNLPVEIFELITQSLAREDVKSMRVVNREFEQKVSRCLFHTSVVPFNTELFDMVYTNAKASSRRLSTMKAQSRSVRGIPSGESAAEPHFEVQSLHWRNAKKDSEGKVYNGHGLRVFQGFGPHIKRFGMSFEVSEDQFNLVPSKKSLNQIEAYHGAYHWPTGKYTRFATLAGLESTADETSRMKAAFSNMRVVDTLALSLDSGLGWLVGPDRSLHSRVFDRPLCIFGSDRLDRSAQEAFEFWNALRQSEASFGRNQKDLHYSYHELETSPEELDGLEGTSCAHTQTWSSIDASRVGLPQSLSSLGKRRFGILHTTVGNDASDIVGVCVTPNSLKTEQKEWLLETGWAQRAFLESYMLAVIDNGNVFNNITTLNIAKLSSGFLPMVSREAFWSALPSLQHCILHVSPEWRTVAKDDAGIAEMTSISSSEAVNLFYDILRTRVSSVNTINSLDIGWVGGGEHAQGMCARNSHLLPAPLSSSENCTANSTTCALTFSHVEHLTLTNCWITPPMLEGLIRHHSTMAMKKLTLDSVSLTAHPRFAIGGHIAAQNAPNPPHLGQAQPWFVQAQQQAANMAQAPHVQLHANLMLNVHQNLPLPPQVGMNAQGVPAPLLPNPPMVPNVTSAPAETHWTVNHRVGGWPDLLNVISPGPVIADYLPQPQPWEEPRPSRPATVLHTIEFKSCGYANLVFNAPFHQHEMDRGIEYLPATSRCFQDRLAIIQPLMMESKDKLNGRIVQRISPHELNALRYAWGLTEGWEDRAKAEEAEYDARLPGGTGRFSGVVRSDMGLVGPTLQ